jgi:hypothetical protein
MRSCATDDSRGRRLDPDDHARELVAPVCTMAIAATDAGERHRQHDRRRAKSDAPH